MDVANFSNPNEPSFVNTFLSRGLYVGIMTIDNNKMDRIYTQLHIFGLGTRALVRGGGGKGGDRSPTFLEFTT